MKKEKEREYLNNIKRKFKYNKASYNLFVEQLNNFKLAEDNFELPKHQYQIKDNVLLKKGTFIHGVRQGDKNLDSIIENGFLSSNIQNFNAKAQKTPYCVSMWNIKEDILLKDYINLYSGMTIKYTDFNDHPTTKLVPYNKLDEEIENSRTMNIWMWSAEQTKEIRFLPSLIRDDNQIAFILNTDNNYAKKIIKNDIFSLEFDKKILKSFISKWFIENFIYIKRDDFTTNRESAIIFGIPSCFIEGVLVGRKLENDKKQLEIIKEKLPQCYICNLNGKIIIT